jgi:hypothetical protein
VTDDLLQPLIKLAPGWGCLALLITLAYKWGRHWLQVHHKRIVLDFARTATPEQVATAKALLEGGAAPALNRDPKPGNLPAALAPMLLVALLLAGCAPTASELLQGGLWSSNARRACSLPGSCTASESCIGSVVVLAAEGAGRAAVRSSASRCAPFTAPPSVAMERAAGPHLFDLGSLGGVTAAVDAISNAVAAQVAAASARAQEREQTRKAVLAQAAHDLAVVQGRAAPGP